ncbi:cellular morphogenesis regulator [Grosmannia clavigera kw1407]|uniref:Cellular morphogenesis regulator n=1 Tax=Grosmannia clavigera (strain kw1407 / UAMH 11150) TaxID=655863 RepID=F0X916_GROCL|nr:cellular morphogenesis regulator [Grosmannia clavigera kw1407]EFX05330.1 cellular morphogenesis regulator [Grosmannia clavigera kw1407]
MRPYNSASLASSCRGLPEEHDDHDKPDVTVPTCAHSASHPLQHPVSDFGSMARELPPGRRSISPDSSGRDSPIPRQWRNQLGGDEPLIKDKAYRKYASGIDRALSLFETALQEWADYISFLNRLLKALQARQPQMTTIPAKARVAKRLSQCLNPTLPSGVHQKALEVYSHVFAIIGRDGLSKDLPVYLPGLAPTLSFASLSARAHFFDLLERYFLDLDPRSMRPALKSLILALLPGLEDETAEDFDRTLKLLNRFKVAVRPPDSQDLTADHATGDAFFWQCFFLAAITSQSRRPGALAYLGRYLPKLGQPLTSAEGSAAPSKDKDGQADPALLAKLSQLVVSPEPGLLLRCFAAGLADEQLLIQRGFLDLLVAHLPLHTSVLQTRVKAADLELLIRAACGVVTRREMSLNRRLSAWLIGPDPPAGENDSAHPESPMAATHADRHHGGQKPSYFEEYGLQPLTRALLSMVQSNASTTPAERARPYRICLSLMDRWEIGGLVVPEVFLPVVDSVRRYKDGAPTKTDFNEVLRSASVFFDGVESGLIYGEMLSLVAQAIGPGPLSAAERADKLDLIKFILEHFNVREEEMITIHAPLSALSVLCMLENTKQQQQRPAAADGIAAQALGIAVELLELVPERAFHVTEEKDSGNSGNFGNVENSEILKQIHDFYVNEQGSLDTASPPYGTRTVAELLLQKASHLSCQSLLAEGKGDMGAGELSLNSQVLLLLLDKIRPSCRFDVAGLLAGLNGCLGRGVRVFSVFSEVLSLAVHLHISERISTAALSSMVPGLVAAAWGFLAASEPRHHVETVRRLWLLQTALGVESRDVEAAVARLVVQDDVRGTFATRSAAAGRTFAVLWLHTLQDSPQVAERRTPRTPKTPNGNLRSFPRLAGVDHCGVMLTRPLLLMLDALLDERTQLFMTVKAWLNTMVGIDRLFGILLEKLLVFVGDDGEGEDKKGKKDDQDDEDDRDLDMCLYYLRTLANVFRWAPGSMWTVLARRMVPEDVRSTAGSLVPSADEVSLQEMLVHVCMRCIQSSGLSGGKTEDTQTAQLCRQALTVLHQILLNPHAALLGQLHLEEALLERLQPSLEGADPFIQVLLLDVLFASLKLREAVAGERPTSATGDEGRLTNAGGQSQGQMQGSQVDGAASTGSTLAVAGGNNTVSPPAGLLRCIRDGLSAPCSRAVLDSWVGFLAACLPLYAESIFQVLIPLVETLCGQIASTFGELQEVFGGTTTTTTTTTAAAAATVRKQTDAPEATLVCLLNALEQLLATGHQQLLAEEARTQTVKGPDAPQGFFGTIFASDAPQTRSATANDRLTVLLAFQDAVRICFRIWCWGKGSSSSGGASSGSSFAYTSLRTRNRARRLLEHLFAAETLECLETAMALWRDPALSSSVLDLLPTLDGSRPKHTIPAVFNAIYSRTNPTALERSRKSTLTVSLQDADIVVFLVDYARSLEDDAMDEIWQDCTTFLKDLLANPFPHRQSLPSLLEFAAILGEKVDNTNFGEQRKMRRELGDLFLRLLTALFTTRPVIFPDGSEKTTPTASTPSAADRADDIVGILAAIVPNLPKIVTENDRVLAAATAISASVIGPTLRAKTFPDTMSATTLVLLQGLAQLPNNQKVWKRDVAEAFNDARFFGSNLVLVRDHWLGLLRLWAVSDKDRMPELLGRITAPTTAGIVFGVGATSARLDADRRTQLNLRRVAVLLLAAASDAFVADLPTITDKLVELLTASPTSSPSSATRPDVYLVLRALVLRVSSVHLAGLWPVVDAELHAAIASTVAPDSSPAADTFGNAALLQACKLLDLVVCLAPDDFQLREWLFVSDTIDAIYRPPACLPVALADELAEALGSGAAPGPAIEDVTALATTTYRRRPLLAAVGAGLSDDVSLERKDELVSKVLRPFFSQLSIYAFEATYAMGPVDLQACVDGVLKDLFDDRGIARGL